MEIILAIAMLCQVGYGDTFTSNKKVYAERVLDCQKYYVKCMEGKGTQWNLRDCILKREAK